MKTSTNTLRIAAVAGIAICTHGASAQDLGSRGVPQSKPICIFNAIVHRVSQPTIAHGYIMFDKGVITAVAEGDTPRLSGEVELIDAKGQHVYPGLIAAHSQLGLVEISTERGPSDTAETGDFKPEVFAATAVNPDSTLIPVQRSNGILTFAAFPAGGTVPGHASVIRADGWTSMSMTVQRDAGLILNWPQVRPIRAEWMDRSEEDQKKEIRQRTEAIDTFFSQAEAYLSRRGSDANTPRDVRLEGMEQTLAKDEKVQRQVFISAQDLDQITNAVTWAAARKLKVVIVGGRDAPLCSELLKANHVSVIVLGTHLFPKRDDSAYDGAFTLPLKLEQAGIQWCLASGQETAHERTLPDAAATAVAYGLDADRAVAAMTLSAAQVLGVSDTLGSLETGKAATLFISSGDVLEIASNPTMAWIDGRTVDLSNKQTKLYEKYKKKYEVR